MDSSTATATNKKISELYRSVKNNSLVLQPEFQRKFVWNAKHRRDFIETILKGLPFPEIYIADRGVDLEKIATQEVVVDGQQRLSTIVQYIDGQLPIKPYNPISSYNNLTSAEKTKFLNYKVTVRQLDGFDSDTIKEIFRRINLTRYSLNAYEIQHAIYDGEFISLAQELSSLLFKSIPAFSETESSRMQDLGFVLLVMATLEHGGYFARDKEIATYIQKYNDTYEGKDVMESKLKEVIQTVSKIELDHESSWYRKSSLFTLFIELAHADAPKDLQDRLIRFERSVQNNKDAEKENDFSKYYAYTYSGTNARQARVERSRIFKQHILNAK